MTQTTNAGTQESLKQEPLKQGHYRLDPAIPCSEAQMDGTDAPALLQTVTKYIGSQGSGYSSYRAVLSALQSS